MKTQFLNSTKYLSVLLMAGLLMFSSVAYAQESPTEQEIIKFCQLKHNGQKSMKDCACMVGKYQKTEAQLIEKNGKIPEKGDVFVHLDYDCHKYSNDGLAEYNKCTRSSSVKNQMKNADLREKYCGCYAQSIETIPAMFAGQSLDQNSLREMEKPLKKAFAESCINNINQNSK